MRDQRSDSARRRPPSISPERRPACTRSTSTRSSAPTCVVELEEVRDPPSSASWRDEVVEEAIGPLRRRRGRPGRSRGSAPGMTLIPCSGRESGTGRARPRPSVVARAARSRGGPYWLIDRRSSRGGTRPARRRRPGEARVRDRAVVALEEVLGDDFPVRRRTRDSRALRNASASRSSPGDRARAAAEERPRAARRRVRVDEDERPPRVELQRHEAESVRSNPGSRSARGAARRQPSRSYVHAW